MNYSRQGEWFEPSKFNFPVHVIGCGATGSFVALQLLKMGVKELHVYDFDVVEEHNVANQVFTLADIGKSKVDAFAELAENCKEVNQQVYAHNEKVDASFRFSGVVFVLTDTMASRKEIWEECLRYKPSVKLVIETRMSINCGRIYAVNPMSPDHVKRYEETLYEDKDAEVSFCGSSLSIIPTAMQIASLATWKIIKLHLEKHISNELLIDIENCNLIQTKWGE